MHSRRIGTMALIGAAALALTLSGTGEAQQRRVKQHRCKTSCPAPEVHTEVRVQGRYQLADQSPKRTVVFDSETGAVYVVEPEQVRTVDPLGAKVLIRRVETKDERGGRVIRSR